MRGGAIGVALLALALLLSRVPASAVSATLEDAREGGAARVEREGSRVILDDPTLGQRVVLERPPVRVVSLTLTSDVLLASLVPASRVVGVTAFVDDARSSSAVGHYPPEVRRVTASAEALLALEPDLLVVSGYSHPQTVRALVGAGVPVLRLPSGRSLDEVREGVVLLSRALDAEANAAPLLASFDRARAELAARPAPAPRRALFLAAGGFTHGAGTLTDELLRLAGAENVASEEGVRGLTRVSAEWVLASLPDVLVVAAPDEASARASLAWSSPGLTRAIAELPVIALTPMAMEATTPECVEASAELADALARLDGDRALDVRDGRRAP